MSMVRGVWLSHTTAFSECLCMNLASNHSTLLVCLPIFCGQLDEQGEAAANLTGHTCFWIMSLWRIPLNPKPQTLNPKPGVSHACAHWHLRFLLWPLPTRNGFHDRTQEQQIQPKMKNPEKHQQAVPDRQKIRRNHRERLRLKKGSAPEKKQPRLINK